MELDRSSTRTITTSLRAACALEVTVPLEKPSIRMKMRGTVTLAAIVTVVRLLAVSCAATMQALVPEGVGLPLASQVWSLRL